MPPNLPAPTGFKQAVNFKNWTSSLIPSKVWTFSSVASLKKSLTAIYSKDINKLAKHKTAFVKFPLAILANASFCCFVAFLEY